MGNEMGNSNVFGLQEQEKTEFGTSSLSLETSAATSSLDDTRAVMQQVSSKEEDLHEGHKGLGSDNSEGIGDLHPEKEAAEKTDPSKAEVQNSEGLLLVDLVRTGANGEETEPVSLSEDGCSHEITSASEKSPSGTSNHQIQKPLSIQSEPESSQVQAPNGSSKTTSGSNDTTDGNDKLISLTKDGSVHETTPAYRENKSTSEHQIQEQASIEIETDTTEVQALEVSFKAALVPNETNDKQKHLISSSEGGNFHETTPDPEKNSSETFDYQVQKQMSNEREVEDPANPSLSTISRPKEWDSFAPVDPTSNQHKHVNVHADSCKEGELELQRCSPDILESNRPHVSENDKNFPDSNSEAERKGHESQKKERESQEENLLDFGDTQERKCENDGEVQVGMTVKAHLIGVENDVKDGQLEFVSFPRQRDPFEKEASEIKDTVVVLSDHKKMEDSSGNGHSKYILNLGLTNDGSVEELETNKLGGGQFEILEIGTSHEDDKKAIEADKLFNNGAKTECKTCETQIIDKRDEVSFQGIKVNSITEKVNKAFTVADTNSEGEKLEICAFSLSSSDEEASPNKAGEPAREREDIEEGEMMKTTVFQSDPIETAEALAQTYLVSLDETSHQDAKQKATSLEPEMVENMKSSKVDSNQDNFSCAEVSTTSQFGLEASVQVETFGSTSNHSQQQEPTILADLKCDHVSNTEFSSPDSNESYKTAMEQESYSPKVDVRSEFSFQFHTPIAEYVVSPIQDEQSVKRVTRGSVSQNLAEPSNKGRIEDSEQSPLLNSDVFELNDYGSDHMASKVDVTKAGEEDFGTEPSEDQMSAEKQVITLERTDSQKSKAPLLSFLNEQNSFAGSQRKQERLVAEKAVEDKPTSQANTDTASSPRGGQKHRRKSSFFSNCMCCTAVIQ